MIAPEGYTIVEADSSQIEARVLAWFAGQNDLTAAFAKGEDVYVKMASRIYQCDEEDVTKDQRFVGKTTILGAGYGMGAEKFGIQLKTFGYEVEPHEAGGSYRYIVTLTIRLVRFGEMQTSWFNKWLTVGKQRLA